MNIHKPRTPEDQKAIDSAMQVVNAIDALARNDDFKRFIASHSERADQLAREILHDDMEPEKREALRNRRLGLLEILLSPKQYRDAQAGVLARYGIHPGDPVE